MSKKEDKYHFDNWNGEVFTFFCRENNNLIRFVSSYRSEVKTPMTLSEIKEQGCVIIEKL